MGRDSVRLEREGAVAVLTLDRPESRNALGVEVQDDLRRALDEVATDDALRAVVLTGAGEKVFVSGADVRLLRDYTAVDGLTGRLQRLFDDIEQFEKPVVAAVNGYALGGGCELALACDVRIASQRAVFGLPETGLSIIPGAGGTQRLSRVVGSGRALELILTGRFVAAEEARQMCLVTRVVAPADLVAAAIETAAVIAAKGPLAVRLARLAVRAGGDADLRTGLLVERLAQAVLHGTQDKQEGITAMLEKRDPHFGGR
jgi:enoyl-CoA hydratase/carnithine racemase